ncbi:MAG: hypothetical protein P4L26_09020 [Terracidiphilus sp.]|nr:hypothetical protein [Terracidiphilus sp.]
MRLQPPAFAVVLLASAAFGQRHVSIPVPSAPSGSPAQIESDVYGSGERGVILARGGRFNKESWRKQAEALARAGFLAVAIDYRGDTVNKDGSDAENAADVLAAASWLRAQGAKSVSGIGASLGGDAVGEADAQSGDGAFDSVVFLGSEGGGNPSKLKGRKLYIVARHDTSGDGPRLTGISKCYAQAPEPKKLVVLRGAAHAQFLFDTAQGPQVMNEILRFLQAK